MGKKILLVNKFYYNRGGAEVVAINLENELINRGFDVAVFTMDYKENFKAQKMYCASTVDFSGSIIDKLKFALRTFGYGDIVKSFKEALESFNPDIVHIHNIHSYLSPKIAILAKKHGCKVIWTLHDYKLLCPAYSCLNNKVVCEKCFNKKRYILSDRCMKQSIIASTLAFLESKKWNKKILEKNTDVFICPSAFMAKQMKKGGFNEDKLHIVCNFIDPLKAVEFLSETTTKRDNYYTYIGRLSPEKGIETLVSVASTLPYILKIAGGGPLSEELKTKYSSNNNIEFLGHLNAVEISQLLKKAKAIIVPSEWYENNPLSLIESLYAGTPVIGANIGGIPELIKNYNGLLFTSGNHGELSECIKQVMGNDNLYDYSEIQKKAYSLFSSDVHIKLMEKFYS